MIQPNTYERFLASKRLTVRSVGREIPSTAVHPALFPFQRDVVRWAVRKGRAALFLDTGLGKTFCQLEWARLIGERTLIVAPLSVARQTVREARKIGLDVYYTRDGADLRGSLNITNYEMVERFNPADFGAVVLDEASILKALSGVTRRKLTAMFANTPFRLCCSATPAPNDYTELGNHAEFLGVCTTGEMLSQFFINANKQHAVVIDGRVYEHKGPNKGGQEWRLKHHAEDPFFEWLSSWAISMTKPSDLGYDDGFILPPLRTHTHFVHAEYTPEDQLFFTGLKGLRNRADVRRGTLATRLDALRKVVSDGDGDQWVIWCGLDAEQRALENSFGSACASIYGSLTPEEKERRLEAWLSGAVRFLITKARVCGFGLNLQQAHKMAFLGLNDSWEAFYQCVRREWRYGQANPVEVHIIMSDAEDAIYHNIMRKEAMAERLRRKLIEKVRNYEKRDLGMAVELEQSYRTGIAQGVGWTLMLGDSCERLGELADNSVDLTCYSPPFADLYTYSPSERDLGNSRNSEEFFEHYAFIIREVLRVTKPGRLACVHTSDVPAMASRDGYIGIKDFPGDVIRAHEREGWTFIGRAFVQKNPQAQAIRVKSKALLFVQLRKDSSDSRPALVDQILIFKKPGENAVPIRPVANGEMDNEVWIEWANGIWLGVHESDTLNFNEARGSDDEKHICPLQLSTIERCIKLYSNPGELVLSPFAGIGSEGYQAIRFGRRFMGIELKEGYFEVARKNLARAEALAHQPKLFSGLESGEAAGG